MNAAAYVFGAVGLIGATAVMVDGMLPARVRNRYSPAWSTRCQWTAAAAAFLFLLAARGSTWQEYVAAIVIVTCVIPALMLLMLVGAVGWRETKRTVRWWRFDRTQRRENVRYTQTPDGWMYDPRRPRS